jgi:hypothetical protein
VTAASGQNIEAGAASGSGECGPGWDAPRCSPKQLAYAAAYYEAHKDEISAKQAAWREAHKDEISAKKAAYYEAHKDGLASAVAELLPEGRRLLGIQNERVMDRRTLAAEPYARTCLLCRLEVKPGDKCWMLATGNGHGKWRSKVAVHLSCSDAAVRLDAPPRGTPDPTGGCSS